MIKPETKEIICPLCEAENKSRFKGFKLNAKQGLFPTRAYKTAQKVYCCGRCGLYFNHPQAQPDQQIFNLDDSLIRLTHLDPERIKSEARYTDILDFLKDKAHLSKGAKVLDMGSGTGTTAFALRQAGYTVFTVEPKKELYDFAIKYNFTDKDRSVNSSFETVQFEENSFDFIFLEPLHHFNEPHQAIQKALKWLKPGAYLHLEVTNSQWLYKKILALIYKFTFRKHVPYTSALRKPFNVCEYSPRSFKTYASLNNLELCELKSYPCNTFIPFKPLEKIISVYMRLFMQGMELSVILRKR